MGGPIIHNFITHDTVFKYSGGCGTDINLYIGPTVIVDGETPTPARLPLSRSWLRNRRRHLFLSTSSFSHIHIR